MRQGSAQCCGLEASCAATGPVGRTDEGEADDGDPNDGAEMAGESLSGREVEPCRRVVQLQFRTVGGQVGWGVEVRVGAWPHLKPARRNENGS